MSSKLMEYADSVKLGLQHVVPHSIEDDGNILAIGLILEGKGSRDGCLTRIMVKHSSEKSE